MSSANGAGSVPRHVNDVFLARNGFIRPNKKLWKKSTEHRLRPACSRCNFRGHSADECKVPYCTKCNKHGHPPKCCSGACANCNVGTSAAVEGEDDHAAEDCPFPKCGNCAGVGHYTDECPHELRRARPAAARPVAGPRIAPAPTAGAAPAAGAPAAGAAQQQRRGLPAGMTSEQARETLVNRLADVFPQHVEKFIDPESQWSVNLVAAAGVAYAELLAALDQSKENEFLNTVARGAAAAAAAQQGMATGGAAAARPAGAAGTAAGGSGSGGSSGAKAYVKGPDGKWHEAAGVNGPQAAAAAPAAAPVAPPAPAPAAAAATAAAASGGAAAPASGGTPNSYLLAVRGAAAPGPAQAAPAAAAAAAAPTQPQPQAPPAPAPAAQQAAPPAPVVPQQAPHPALPHEVVSSNPLSSADAPAPPPQHASSLLSAAPGAGRPMHGAVGGGSVDLGGPAVGPLSLAVGSPVTASVGQHLAAAGLVPVGAPAAGPDVQMWGLVKRLQDQATTLTVELGSAKDSAAAADAKAAGLGSRVSTLESRLAEAEARAKSAEAKAVASESAALAARNEAQLARQSQSVLQSTLLQAFRQMGVDTRLLEYYLSVQGLLGPTAAAAAPGAGAAGQPAAPGGPVGGGGAAPGAIGSGREVGGPVGTAVGSGAAVQQRGQDSAAAAAAAAQSVAQAVERSSWGAGGGWGTWS